MNKMITDTVWLCDDCTIAECNGDYSGMSDERAAEVSAAFDRMTDQGCLALNDGPEGSDEGHIDFTWRACECCQGLAGSRTRFSLWEHPKPPLSSASPDSHWEEAATRLGVTVAELKSQVALADAVMKEIIAEENEHET